MGERKRGDADSGVTRRDVFDSVVSSANRTGPMLKKTVLGYRYGHYVFLGLTELFVFPCDLKTDTVSDEFLINVDHQLQLESTKAEILECVRRWVE